MKTNDKSKSILSCILFAMLVPSCVKQTQYKLVIEYNDFDSIKMARTTKFDTLSLESKSKISAFTEGCNDFYLRQSVYERNRNNNPKASLRIPINYDVIDNSNKSILSEIPETERKRITVEVSLKIFKDVDPLVAIRSEKKIDSAELKKYEPYISKITDEFDMIKATTFQAKSAPKYVNTTATFCYFKEIENNTTNLRLRIQYFEEDWLFIQSYTFLIDDEPFILIPDNVETDSGLGGKIWEWCDVEIDEGNKELIRKILSAKSVKIKYNGKQYYDIKQMSEKDLIGIKNLVNFYKAKGGEI